CVYIGGSSCISSSKSGSGGKRANTTTTTTTSVVFRLTTISLTWLDWNKHCRTMSAVKMNREKIDLCREACIVFAKDGDSCIFSKDIGTVMRAMGYSPTESEVRNIQASVDNAGKRKLTDQDVVSIISKQQITQDTDEELKEAFRVFDKDGNGYISCAELRHVLTNLGEKLTHEEVDEMIREADITADGRVNYDDFVKILKS
ncbi:calmodulin-like isoform X1, partial [Argonauta hians]